MAGRWAGALLSAVVLGLVGCSDPGPAGGEGSRTSASSTPAPSGPDDPSAPSAEPPVEPGTPAEPGPSSVTAAGVSLDVPAGWGASTTSVEDQAAALDRLGDPQAAGLLQQRFEVLGAQGGALVAYDLRGVAEGRATVVEVYRYPPEATTEQVVATLEARYQEIQTPFTQTSVELPAGPAVLIDTPSPVPGSAPSTQVYLVTVGPSLVAVNVVDSAASPEVAAVVASIRAG